jgi:hypothetical protein
VVDRLGRRDWHLLRLTKHLRRPTGPADRLHERGGGKPCRWADGALRLEMRQRMVQFRSAADWDIADGRATVVMALRAEAAVAAFWSWEYVRLGMSWVHEVCCVRQSRHLPAARRQDRKAVACILVSAVLLVGSELAFRTRTLRSCRAGGGGARTNIAGSIERLVRIVLTVTLATGWTEAGLASGQAVALAEIGDGTSPAILDIGQRRE